MRRALLVVCSSMLAPLACVDLFHSTDFETLCDREPSHAACSGGGDADAAEATLDFCAWTPTEARKRADRACAWLGACAGPLGDSSFGRCVVRALSAFDCSFNPGLRPTGGTHALWSCLAQVESCADVDACLYEGRPPPECAPVPSGSFTACAGAFRVECANPQRGRATGLEPCALEGRSCVRIDESRASCAGHDGNACASPPTCNGTFAVECTTAGLDRGRDCAGIGSGTCVASSTTAACAPIAGAPACSGGQEVVCDGSVATSCVGGKKVSFDCSRIGAPCDTSEPVPPSDAVMACADRTSAGRCTGPDTCSGDTLRSCANGVAMTVACSSVGLGPCVARTNDLAACSLP